LLLASLVQINIFIKDIKNTYYSLILSKALIHYSPIITGYRTGRDDGGLDPFLVHFHFYLSLLLYHHFLLNLHILLFLLILFDWGRDLWFRLLLNLLGL